MDGITGSIDMHSSKLRVIMKDREAWRAAVCGVAKRVGHDLATKQRKKPSPPFPLPPVPKATDFFCLYVLANPVHFIDMNHTMCSHFYLVAVT